MKMQVIKLNSKSKTQSSVSASDYVWSTDHNSSVIHQSIVAYLANNAKTQAIMFAVSDESTALTTGTGKLTFRMPYAMTLFAGVSGIKASLTTAGSTSGVTTIGVNEAGSTILSTKLTIDSGETTSVTAATPPVISDTALAADAIITVDIDGLSGGATEAGLKITLIGIPA